MDGLFYMSSMLMMNGSAQETDTCIASISDAKVKYATFAPNFQGMGLPRSYWRAAIELIT
jgi:ribosomal protein S18 acetylase RimI-like enzyme